MNNKAFRVGDKVMGFVTIRTGRRELRRGTIVKEEDGRFKLDSGVWASNRELILQDTDRLERALEYWNKYHETLDSAERYYSKAMTAIYLNVCKVICRVGLPDMGFTTDKVYEVVNWSNEGLMVINDSGAPVVVAAVPIGDQPSSDRWFRQHFSVIEYECGCERS